MNDKDHMRFTQTNQTIAKTAAASEKEPLRVLLWAMVFLSGFACLVYQILWMRQLGLMLGNTSQATALTLALFFGGLAFGGGYWGRRCERLANPLRMYGWLELGIAGCGVLVMFAPGVMAQLYPVLYQRHGQGAVLWLFKLLWTWMMVFPPAMLMGGTLPVMGQAMVRQMAGFGKTAARLYAVNTLGAACGAFATAFVCIAWLGMRMTCGVAMAASILAALFAAVISRQGSPAVRPSQRGSEKVVDVSRRWLRFLAFFSGFQLLALEVIATRMLAQVHENSVYGFSAVLIVVLVCLALGAWLAAVVARSTFAVSRVLVVMMVLGAAWLGMVPLIFAKLTQFGEMLPTDRPFASYVWQLFQTTFLTLGPACFLLGSVFPLLIKGEEAYADTPGRSLGNLAAINTLGAIGGSLVAGFFLLEWLGVGRSVQAIAVLYLLVAVVMPMFHSNPSIRSVKYVACGMAFLPLIMFPPKLISPAAVADHWGGYEILLEKWESSDCTVTAVKDSRRHVSIKINGNYSLGSTFAYVPQIQQSRVPLLAFPQTESVFFLGMGTGITAGEALDRESYPQVSRVVACELSPAVVTASRKYFAGGTGEPDLTNGLYHDERSQVLVADGRHHLMASAERYSMINADLFLPYRRGTGNLYSREHFQQVRARLKPGGVFVQWLPLYQISENELGIIARTMLAVFPQVSLWRGNFQPGAEVAALVGHADLEPLPACSLEVEDAKREAVAGATHREMLQLLLPINEQTVLLFYAGNVSRAAELFAKYPLNTDDRPVMEFGTPRSLHRAASEGKPQFVQERFAGLVDSLLERTPPSDDSLLAKRSVANRELVRAGAAFHRASIASVSGEETRWREEWENFLKHWLAEDR